MPSHRRLAGDVDQLLGVGGGLAADDVHLGAVAEVAAQRGGDVEVDDVAGEEHAVARDAVADDLVGRGADRLREALVVERRGVGAVLDDELVAQAIERAGGHARDDVRLDEVEHLRGEATGGAHLLDLCPALDLDGHVLAFAERAEGTRGE
jgi:hypothetical protein